MQTGTRAARMPTNDDAIRFFQTVLSDSKSKNFSKIPCRQQRQRPIRSRGARAAMTSRSRISIEIRLPSDTRSTRNTLRLQNNALVEPYWAPLQTANFSSAAAAPCNCRPAIATPQCDLNERKATSTSVIGEDPNAQLTNESALFGIDELLGKLHAHLQQRRRRQIRLVAYIKCSAQHRRLRQRTVTTRSDTDRLAQAAAPTSSPLQPCCLDSCAPYCRSSSQPNKITSGRVELVEFAVASHKSIRAAVEHGECFGQRYDVNTTNTYDCGLALGASRNISLPAAINALRRRSNSIHACYKAT